MPHQMKNRTDWSPQEDSGFNGDAEVEVFDFQPSFDTNDGKEHRRADGDQNY